MSSDFIVYFLSLVLIVASLFMVLLVLIQRGRGGGLAGAFGGMGGQSAFGTRAGDVFTKVTVVVAVLFILVAAVLGRAMRANQRAADTGAKSGFSGPSAADIDTDEEAAAANAISDEPLVTPGTNGAETPSPADESDSDQSGADDVGAGDADAEESEAAEDESTDSESTANSPDDPAESEDPAAAAPAPETPAPETPAESDADPGTDPSDDEADEDTDTP